MENNPLAMSDEDFLKLNGPSEISEGSVTATEDAKVEDADVEVVAEEAVVVEAETIVEADKVVEDKSKTVTPPVVAVVAPVAEVKKGEPNKAETKVNPKAPVAAKVEPEKNADGTPKVAPVVAAVEPDYKTLYGQIMAPLKANGKVIELKTPEEAIQLMQMGANFTKKMQAIAPHRKLITMLENNGLLDENKISYLIDLDKKNPDAIKKLVKDSGIDPLEIDPKAATTYLQGNHKVTDEEVSFKTAVEDIKSTPTGLATLAEINSWDQASKEVLWKNPDIMEVMHSQLENGIYRQIQTEVDRRRTLGTIPASTPFINAYKLVGDELAAAGKFGKPAVAASVVATTPVVTRVATPKVAVADNARVNAASSTRSTPRSAAKGINPLAMSDDDFLKHMASRL